MKITHLIEESSYDQFNENFAMDILVGLCSNPKRIPSKYFYDDQGSRLFQEITRQEDYYLTRTEFSILESLSDVLPEHIPDQELDIIELGAGDGHKTKLIIDGFLKKGRKINFYPIDISAEAMQLLRQNLDDRDNLKIHGVVAEYIQGLQFTRKQSHHRQLVLFLGSNIGNFEMAQAQRFLYQVWASLNHNDFMLIGFDQKKDIQKLIQAYNDKAGITTKFNLNLLDRINSELGGNFDRSQFQHFGSYNPLLGAMESYLISLKDQEVSIKRLERKFEFKAYEPVLLEYSFKFLPHDISNLAENIGYSLKNNFTDDQNFFTESLWQVEKN